MISSGTEGVKQYIEKPKGFPFEYKLQRHEQLSDNDVKKLEKALWKELGVNGIMSVSLTKNLSYPIILYFVIEQLICGEYN
jgi:hypothetical protein